MEEKKFERIKITLPPNEIYGRKEEGTYILEFDMKQVKALAAESRQARQKGEAFLEHQLYKFALKKNHGHDATEELAHEVYAFFQTLNQTPGFKRTYAEMLALVYELYGNAIEAESMTEEPALIDIDRNNNIVTVEYNGEKFKLMFSRNDLEQAYATRALSYDYSNPLELYTFGLELVKLGMRNTMRRYSLNMPERVFLAMWRTATIPETKDLFAEALYTLLDHREDVLNSGSKNFKPATIELE
jgi:uncharacterized protein YuzE